MLKTYTFILIVFVLASCSDRADKVDDKEVVQFPQSVREKDVDTLILSLNRVVLSAMKAKDYSSLVTYFHPTTGVRFSPYGYIDTTVNVIFTNEKFLQQFNANKQIYWGQYDGSGDSILLTVKDYFLKFVYNADYLNAEKTSLDKMIGSGNSLNNLQNIYKDCFFTESYFSGFDKKYEGMDWCSLRLVFKKHLTKFYLVGIIHDQWTI